MQCQISQKDLYSTIGKGMLIYNASAILTALFLIVILEFYASFYPNSTIRATGGWLLLINAIAVYGISPLILLKIVRQIPVYKGIIPPIKNGVSPAAETAIITVLAMGIAYIVNFISSGMERLTELGTNIELHNPIEVTAADSPQLIWFLSVAVIAPVVEELVFRKILLTRIRWTGNKEALLLSSAFFAIFHGNLQQAAYAFPMGLVIGYLMLRTGSILYPVICHVCCNLTTGILIPALSETLPGISLMLVFSITATTIILLAKYRLTIAAYIKEQALPAYSSPNKQGQPWWLIAYFICGIGYCILGTLLA